MFVLKKILSEFLFPLPLCLIIAALGLVLLWFTQKKTAGKALCTLSFFLILLISTSPFSKWILKSLEREYPVFDWKANPSVEWVVVLGGGLVSDPVLPVTSQLSCSSVLRVLEGLRLHKIFPESKLLFSGGKIFDPVPEAEALQRLALDLGVSLKNVVLETDSKNTEDQAKMIHGMIGELPFALVTSAHHMKRAMALFEKCGMHPIPAPCDFRIKNLQIDYPRFLAPSGLHLMQCENAWKEYLGLVWAKLRGL
jgi:uncharacterized SAM-binding protein YcdF (DUF218 family)